MRAPVLLNVVNRQVPAKRLLDCPLATWTRITEQLWDEASGARPN